MARKKINMMSLLIGVVIGVFVGNVHSISGMIYKITGGKLGSEQ